jgi:hypothetical protein
MLLCLISRQHLNLKTKFGKPIRSIQMLSIPYKHEEQVLKTQLGIMKEEIQVNEKDLHLPGDNQIKVDFGVENSLNLLLPVSQAHILTYVLSFHK